MASDISQAFQEELTCFICLSCLTDPVTISCGHSFCRACLYLSWEDIEPPVHCPLCREPSEQKDFGTNIILKELVSMARQASLMKHLSSEEHQCVTHKDTKRIFCVENRIYLCQLCSDSHEHRGHQHSPIEVAAEGKMEKLLKQMASLREKIQENNWNLEPENRMTTLWMDYLRQREQMVRTEYRELHPDLSEEEEQHIECMKNEGRLVLEKLREREATMVQTSKQLREMYQELMVMSKEPYELLLQGLDDMFRRSESMQQLSMPQTLNPELTALPISGLTERFSHFQANIVFEAITICHNHVNLFNIMRRWSFRPHCEDISVDSARSYLASCGSQGFISGKYYWELDLNDSWNWAVGVCKDSWISNRNQRTESEDAFLLVCVKEGDHYSLLTTCPVLQHYIERPLGRIGVFLDCEGGCLSFLDVAKSSLIYKYLPGTFNPSVRPFFSTGPM